MDWRASSARGTVWLDLRAAGTGWPKDTRQREPDDAVSTTDPAYADPRGRRPRPALPARGRAGSGSAHGARWPGARVLRASRAPLEVPRAGHRTAPAQEGPQAPRIRRHAAAAARSAVGGRDRLQ